MEKAKVRDLAGKLEKGDSFYLKVDIEEIQPQADGRIYIKTKENGNCVNGWLFGGDTYELNDVLVSADILERPSHKTICIDGKKYKLVPQD